MEQQKLPVGALQHLGTTTLRALSARLGTSLVMDSTFVGISPLGSHIYNLNTHQTNEFPRGRLYVRLVDGELRGELDEEKFNSRRRIA